MEEVALQLDRLSFSIEKSLRYHQRRRGFFEAAHRFLMFAIILLGSAAAASIFGASKWLSFVAALVAAVDLVWAPGTQAREHLVLHQRFSTLMSQIVQRQNPSAEQLAGLRAERVEIEADEPPIYWALERDCYNEVCYALGRDKDPTNLNKLNWFERAFMNFLRFDRASASS